MSSGFSRMSYAPSCVASTAVWIVAWPLIITTVADGVDLLDAPERLEPVHPGHLHVHEHEVRTPLLVLGDPVGRVADRVHLVALELEQLAERCADSLLVVDDEDASAHLVAL